MTRNSAVTSPELIIQEQWLKGTRDASERCIKIRARTVSETETKSNRGGGGGSVVGVPRLDLKCTIVLVMVGRSNMKKKK